MGRFTDRVAIITGGARGIGRATARRLLDEDASVVIADVDGEEGRQTADELGGGPRVLAVSCDVTVRADVDAMVAACAAQYGRLDVLVNNVGFAGPASFEELTEAEWRRQTDATLDGAVRCIQAALPYLKESAVGAVVSVGSVNGLAALGAEPYSAAKAGLVNLTENLAVRYGPDGIRFNVVAPGSVRTRVWDGRLASNATLDQSLRKLYPLGRVGEPEDIAAAIAFLASDDAAWITGTVLRVDGGLLASVPGFLSAVREAESTA